MNKDKQSAAARRNLWRAVGLLAVGLLVTVLVSLFFKAEEEASAQREFDFTCNDIRLNIEARLDACAAILRSGAALFDASETVSREQWLAFTERLNIQQNLPGIQGIGFALLVPRAHPACPGDSQRRLSELRDKACWRT